MYAALDFIQSFCRLIQRIYVGIIPVSTEGKICIDHKYVGIEVAVNDTCIIDCAFIICPIAIEVVIRNDGLRIVIQTVIMK